MKKIPEGSMYVLREQDPNIRNQQYTLVDIYHFKLRLLSELRWLSEVHNFTEEQTIHDYILICFFAGNDFLPNIPSLEISNQGLEELMNIYPHITAKHGHFTYKNAHGIICLNTKSLKELFVAISKQEKSIIIRKISNIKNKNNFPDPILQRHTTETLDVEHNSVYNINFKEYLEDYHLQKIWNKRRKVQ